MVKTVAVEGDVTAETGTKAFEADTDNVGSWSAGPVIDTSYSHLKINGTPVIYKSECLFTYAGGTTSASGSPVPVPPFMETVTLEAGATVLQSGNDQVLVDGDSEESSYGNKLTASPSDHVSTA